MSNDNENTNGGQPPANNNSGGNLPPQGPPSQSGAGSGDSGSPTRRRNARKIGAFTVSDGFRALFKAIRLFVLHNATPQVSPQQIALSQQELDRLEKQWRKRGPVVSRLAVEYHGVVMAEDEVIDLIHSKTGGGRAACRTQLYSNLNDGVGTAISVGDCRWQWARPGDTVYEETRAERSIHVRATKERVSLSKKLARLDPLERLAHIRTLVEEHGFKLDLTQLAAC